MKKPAHGVSTASDGPTASQQIDARIAELDDWRGATLARVRALILAVDPHVQEEVKWRGVPVWSHGGILCTGETYKAVVKLTFAHGASLPDPSGLFNASLEGNTRRAIDLHEGDRIDANAFQALMRAAIARNAAKSGGAKGAARSPAAGKAAKSASGASAAKSAATTNTKTKTGSATRPATARSTAKTPTPKKSAPAQGAAKKAPARRAPSTLAATRKKATTKRSPAPKSTGR